MYAQFLQDILHEIVRIDKAFAHRNFFHKEFPPPGIFPTGIFFHQGFCPDSNVNTIKVYGTFHIPA